MYYYKKNDLIKFVPAYTADLKAAWILVYFSNQKFLPDVSSGLR